MSKTALITGITGQDGSYLAEFLLRRRYRVYGLIRRSSSFNTSRIDHIYQDPHERDLRLRLIYGDLNDASSVNKILGDVQPDEIYNLGAQSHVMVSFDIPEYTGEVTGLGTVRLLEGIRQTRIGAKFYQASSSELYGLAQEVPQKETTPFYPRSPYACAKAYAFYMVTQLPGSLRPICLQRHLVQPRKPETRRNVRQQKNHPRGDTHQRRTAGKALFGKSRGKERLGIRARVC